MNPSILPVNVLRCMSEADRKSLGKSGLLPEEAIAKQVAKTERELQGQIVNLLRLRNIEVCWHRTDKKSAATIGWPDLTFAVLGTRTIDDETLIEHYSCAWEVKLPSGELSKEQAMMAVRLQSPPNNWTWRVIYSVDSALEELRAMGL